MKKLFTIDDFMVAFISALGYGFGYTIPMHLGWPELACLVACFALGIALEEIISKIVFSKTVQQKTVNRVFTYVAILLVFLIAEFVSTRLLGTSLMEDLEEEFAWVVGLPILGLIVNLLIRGYRVRKIRKRYGNGSQGYVFDVTDKDIEEVNRQNQSIRSEYDTDCAVKTRTGVYVGEKYKKTLIFTGIPYAKPPVGALRWKAPELLPSSDDVFEAKNFGASAIQVEHKGSIIRHHRQSEDCLTLNIAAGAKKTDAKKPVLVLFHHGDFTYGGAVDPLLYGGDYVNAHQDVVLVSFNYRLGIFGFIDFSEVPGGEACPDALNLGLLDQIAALKWIRENIGSFGGDPERITVLGFESGATCICLLAASEQAKGLFQRAFVFNGSPESAYDTPDASRALAKALLEETNTSTMSELLHLDTEALKNAAQRLWMNMCAPTCDGKLIPKQVYEAYRNGAASGIEFIVGITSGEMQVIRSSVGGKNYEDAVNAAVDNLQGDLDSSTAEAVRAYIEAQTAASSELEAKSKLVGQWIALGVYRVASMLSQGGNKVHLMYWDEKALIENLGSGTADVLAALLGNGEALQMYGSVMNADLSETLQALLLKFVSGEAMQLYRNEISGFDGLDWKAFPQALIVSDGKFACDTIEDRITAVKADVH
ncbi:MAG: carboxylesterase family protein [Clostridia bacterium]|nr:carboxylesterase family protein [Clostridia bacterium]MBO6270273.1 carboxylesterase family protein [Clostridium sp.]